MRLESHIDLYLLIHFCFVLCCCVRDICVKCVRFFVLIFITLILRQGAMWIVFSNIYICCGSCSCGSIKLIIVCIDLFTFNLEFKNYLYRCFHTNLNFVNVNIYSHVMPTFPEIPHSTKILSDIFFQIKCEYKYA